MAPFSFTHRPLTIAILNPSTVKAAKKLKSCLCCIPGEGEEDEEDDEDGDNEDGGKSLKPKGIDLSVPGAFAATSSRYVDGKAQFAFDPTMFNK